jgi:hypothetical protein
MRWTLQLDRTDSAALPWQMIVKNKDKKERNESRASNGLLPRRSIRTR